MITESFARMKDLPTRHVMGPGTSICPGCGGLAAIKEFYDILGENTVFVNAAGCMSLLSVYPYTPFPGSWLYTSMASAPAGAQGVRDALDLLQNQGKIRKADDLEVVVLTGDGAANGIGMSATSGAFDRNLDYYYLCYDNEGYGNTGQQSSAATPHGAKTSTSTDSHGFKGYKKDLFAIWVAHKPVYAATIIAAEPLDLARKIEKARSLHGPKMFIALSPCPTGWNFEAAESVEIGRMAVKTGIWPLREYMDGNIVHTRIPRSRPPVEEFLKLQGRFSHLFEPSRDDRTINEIQAEVDAYWNRVESC